MSNTVKLPHQKELFGHPIGLFDEFDTLIFSTKIKY